MKKMMKKLLLACVTAAVLISCFCVAAFAEVGNGKIEDILEYYDESKVFAYDTFDSAEDSKRLSVSGADAEFDGGLAKIVMTKRTRVSYTVDSLTGSVGANLRFRVEGENVGRMMLELMDREGTSRALFTFDFAAGTLTYTLTAKDATSQTETVADVTLTAGTFYTAALFYDKEAKTVTLSLTDETSGKTTTTGAIATPDITSAGELTFRLPSGQDENRVPFNDGVTFTVDYAEIYTGSFPRTFAEKQEKTEKAVLDLVNRYNTEGTSDADKEALITTLHTVLARGFVATEGTPAYEALYGGDSMEGKIPYVTFAVTFYTQKMLDAVGKIDVDGTYEERRAFVDEMDNIHEIILAAGVDDPEDDSDYAAALTKYRTESAAVEKIRTDAELFLKTLTGIIPTRLDYAGCSDILDTLGDREIDRTYPGVADLMSTYDQIVALKNAADEKASTFLSAVLTLSDEEETFATRYTAYTTAGASYYSDLSYFTVDAEGETTHPVEGAIALYTLWSEYFDKIVAYNESFLSYVSRAVYATERSSRLGCIMSAEELMKDEDGNLLVEIAYIRTGTLTENINYTNSVEKAIEKIEEMNKSLEADKVAIAKYIEAVKTLKAAGTIPEKKALLEATRALRVAEDPLTVEGVVEANIAFSSVEAEVALWEGNSKLVLTSVEALKKTSDLSERAGLILRARAALAALQDKTYEGVTDAETYLAQAVKEYNKSVAQMNETFARETDAALDVSYAAAPKTIVGVIAWITKENY